MAEEQKAFSVPEILNRYRDLGSDWYPKDDIYLSCDPAFNRYTRLWVKGPTLDATHGAMETLLLLGCADFDREGIYDVLRQHFCPKTGTFATNGIPVSGGIYGLHNAIGVLKSLHGLTPKQALGLALYEEALGRIGRGSPKRYIERFKVFLRECASSGRSSGGLVDHPAMKPRRATVTTLHTATSTLWNLWEGDFKQVLGEIVPIPKVERFIRNCLHEKEIDGHKVAAFSINPQVKELCTNTTFFALETFWHLEREKLFEREDLLTLEQREKILTFLTRIAWVPEAGGFRSTEREIPSLNATFFGLRALRRLSKPAFEDFVKANLPAIHGFVTSCSIDGGYAFTNLHDRYLPTPLGTRYALQIRELLHQRGFDVPSPGQSPDDVRLVDFIQHELRDPKTGAYQGYPADRIRGAKRFDANDLYDWDPAEYEERTAKAQQLFALLADGLQKVWSLKADEIAYGEPEEVRLRDGSVILRRPQVSKTPPSRPLHRLRKNRDGSFSIVALPSSSSKTSASAPRT
ncbi:MAG TPA: hypothetical protein VF756_25485 [Thermoanaerobaculia bacterium]